MMGPNALPVPSLPPESLDGGSRPSVAEDATRGQGRAADRGPADFSPGPQDHGPALPACRMVRQAPAVRMRFSHGSNAAFRQPRRGRR